MGEKKIVVDRQQPPMALTAAALVALVALGFTARLSPTPTQSGAIVATLIFLGLALLGSRAIFRRLPRGRVLSWSLRAVMIVLIIAIIGIPQEDSTGWFFKPPYTNLIGCILAAELVLRAWEQRPAERMRESHGVVLLLTALILTLASNTYQRLHIQIITPVYLLLIILTLRILARPDQILERVNKRASLIFLRITALLLTLGIGFAIVRNVTKYDYQLTSLAVELLQQQRSRKSEIGFSTTPRLRAVFNPTASVERVLLIDGPPSERHLRAMAFDTYENREWRPGLAERSFLPMSSAQAAIGAQLVFTRLSDTQGLLPVPLEAVAIKSNGAMEQDLSGDVRNRAENPSEQYDVVLDRKADYQGPLCTPPDRAARDRLLVIPRDIDAKVSAIARKIAGDGNAISRVIKLQQHLRSTHRYSLMYEPQGEPLSDFILNGRSAHCQYFASALVVMCRAAGVPARYVTGYYAHENYGRDQMVVRQRDAHAWAECWIDGTGWITVDATPAGGRPDQIFPRPSIWQRLWERVRDIPRTARAWLARIHFASVWIILPLSAVTMVWIVRSVSLRRRKKPADTLAYANKSEQLTRAADRFDRWLKRRGIPCAPDRTWREHLISLERNSGTEVPLPLRACLRFVDRYDVARFGENSDALSQMHDLLDDVEKNNG